MQKVVILIIIGLAGIGGGYFLYTQSAKNQSQPASTTQKADTNVFTSIKDAISKSLTLECNFTDEKEGKTTKAYIKAGGVRADVTAKSDNESGSVIYKDNKMYFWNKNEGFMMEFTDENSATTSANSKLGSPQNEGQNILNDIEKYKESCKAAVVSSDLFTPPATVKFTDFSSMMKKIPTIPTGVNGVPSIDQKQYEDLLKQYAPQANQ